MSFPQQYQLRSHEKKDPQQYDYIGTHAEWQPLLDAFERFRRIEILDQPEVLYILSDVVLGSGYCAAISCKRCGDGETSGFEIFLETRYLAKLAQGCTELLSIAKADRFGAFRSSLCDGWLPKYGREPILDEREYLVVETNGKNIIGLLRQSHTVKSRPIMNYP